MELLIAILTKVECLSPILTRMVEAGVTGGTVLDSQGMMTVLGKDDVEPPPIFGSLRQFMNPERESSKTILVVLPHEQVKIARDIIDEEVGGLQNHNTAILFTLPLDYVEGTAPSKR